MNTFCQTGVDPIDPDDTLANLPQKHAYCAWIKGFLQFKNLSSFELKYNPLEQLQLLEMFLSQCACVNWWHSPYRPALKYQGAHLVRKPTLRTFHSVTCNYRHYLTTAIQSFLFDDEGGVVAVIRHAALATTARVRTPAVAVAQLLRSKLLWYNKYFCIFIYYRYNSAHKSWSNFVLNDDILV